MSIKEAVVNDVGEFRLDACSALADCMADFQAWVASRFGQVRYF